jgi:hypothetical protein
MARVGGTAAMPASRTRHVSTAATLAAHSSLLKSGSDHKRA